MCNASLNVCSTVLRYRDRATSLNWTMTARSSWTTSTTKGNRFYQFFHKRFNQRRLQFLFAYLLSNWLVVSCFSFQKAFVECPSLSVKGIFEFLQRVSIACYAERCISHSKSVRLPSVCPSVCPSVTRWHWVKRTQATTIMGSSLEDSPMTLVSSTLDFTAKFQKEHGERGRRMRKG